MSDKDSQTGGEKTESNKPIKIIGQSSSNLAALLIQRNTEKGKQPSITVPDKKDKR